MEEIEHFKFNALFTALIDTDKKEKAIEAYELYFTSAFPYLDVEGTRTDQKLIDFLRQEVARGPIAVKKLDQGMRSRMASKRRRADPKLLNRSGRILKKIGRTVE